MPLQIVKRHGSHNWYLRGSIRGIVVDESTWTSNREAAEAIRIKREGQILDRSVFGAKATITFTEAALSYMQHGGERRFMDPLLVHFKGRPLSTIGQADIDRAAKVIYPAAGKSTHNRQVYTPMSAVLEHAARRGWTDHRRLQRPSQPKGSVRWITHQEATMLVTACAPHLAPLVTFLFATGCRLSEALYLQWSCVDLQRAHVTFPETKSGKPRGVPLSPRAVASLANLKHRVGPVFLTNKGLPYSPKGEGGGQIKTAFGGACRRAGIEDFSPHDCRHTFATWHYAANRDLGELMQICGWASVEMAMRYAHVNVANLGDGVARTGW